MLQKTRAFLEEFRVSPQDFVGDYIPISPGISHPGEGCPQQVENGVLEWRKTYSALEIPS